jgi:hypothetical protein
MGEQLARARVRAKEDPSGDEEDLTIMQTT